jgi:hypothetical protein
MRAMKRKERQSLARGEIQTRLDPFLPMQNLISHIDAFETRMTAKVLKTGLVKNREIKKKQPRNCAVRRAPLTVGASGTEVIGLHRLAAQLRGCG